MTKKEIAFLLENGYTVADIMTMNSQEQTEHEQHEQTEHEQHEQTEHEQHEQTEQEQTEQKEPEQQDQKDQPDAIKELNRSIADLHKEIEKLAGRIAAQGIRSAGADAPRDSIDDTLANIAKKLNGGK